MAAVRTMVLPDKVLVDQLTGFVTGIAAGCARSQCAEKRAGDSADPEPDRAEEGTDCGADGCCGDPGSWKQPLIE